MLSVTTLSSTIFLRTCVAYLAKRRTGDLDVTGLRPPDTIRHIDGFVSKPHNSILLNVQESRKPSHLNVFDANKLRF